jgi:hypothetical protein
VKVDAVSLPGISPGIFEYKIGRYRLRKLVIEIVPFFKGIRERGKQAERQKKIDKRRDEEEKRK